MLKHKLVDFIIQFMEEVDKEISEMKLFVCQQTFFNREKADMRTVECKSQICGGILLDSGRWSMSTTLTLFADLAHSLIRAFRPKSYDRQLHGLSPTVHGRTSGMQLIRPVEASSTAQGCAPHCVALAQTFL